MPYVPVNILLDRELKPRESLDVAYPRGTSGGSFFGGFRHTLGVSGDFYRCPKDFIITPGNERLQLTWMGTRIIPKGTLLNLQLEQPGNDFFFDQKTGVTVANMVASNVFLVNLGAPMEKDPFFYIPEGYIESAGQLPLIHRKPDAPRNVCITGVADNAHRVFRVEGNDIYGNTMVEEIAGPWQGQAHGKKAFASIVHISVDGACEGEIAIGTGNRFGLPVFLPAPGYCLRVLLNGMELTGGVLVPGETAYPTATSGDRRGTYAPPEGAGLDGSKALHLLMSLPNPGNIGIPDFAG